MDAGTKPVRRREVSARHVWLSLAAKGLLLLALAACDTPSTTTGKPAGQTPRSPGSGESGQGTADRGSQAPQTEREKLIQTEREFCALAQSRGLAEAFHQYLAPDATELPMAGRPIRGREQITEHIRTGGPATMVWQPAAAEVAASGDFGYTWGNYVWRGLDSEGRNRTNYGKYISVWKKQPDGSWRVIVDGGNSSPPPEPPPQQ